MIAPIIPKTVNPIKTPNNAVTAVVMIANTSSNVAKVDPNPESNSSIVVWKSVIVVLVSAKPSSKAVTPSLKACEAVDVDTTASLVACATIDITPRRL